MHSGNRICSVLSNNYWLMIFCMPIFKILLHHRIDGFSSASLQIPSKITVDADNIKQLRDLVFLYIYAPDLTQRQATGVPLTKFYCLRTSQGLWQTHLFRSNETREQAVLRPHLCRFDGTESSHSRSLGHKISQMDTKSNTRGYEIKRYEYRNS